MQKTLSIIVPYRDRSKDLLELLRSIPDVEDIEVLLVNDHSRETLELPHLKKLILHQISLKDGQRYAGTARNLGIAHSTGKYLFFADSDDWFITEALQKCLVTLRDASDDCIYVRMSSQIDESCETGRRHLRYNALVDQYLISKDDYILTNYSSPCGRFIRREHVVKNGLIFDEIIASNDVMFSLHLALSEPKNSILHETVYVIREGNTSLTNTYSQNVIDARTSTLIKFNETLRDAGLKRYQIAAGGYLLRLLRIDRHLFLQELLKFVRNRQPILPIGKLQIVKALSRFRTKSSSANRGG